MSSADPSARRSPCGPGSAWRSLCLAALALALTTGCRADLGLHIEVGQDGTGVVEAVVELDAAAVERLGGDLAAVLSTEDLALAGWEVIGPTEAAGGAVTVRARREFHRLEEAQAVLADVAGEAGAFQGFELRHEGSFGWDRWRMHGRVDLSGGIEAFGDDGLAAHLGGEPVGLSTEELEAQLGQSIDRLASATVSVRLPGQVRSTNATEHSGGAATWDLAWGEGPVALEATSSRPRLGVLGWTAAGALASLALAVLALARLRRLLGRRTVGN